MRIAEQRADEAYRLTAEGWELAQRGRDAEAEECYRRAYAADPRTYLKHVGRQDLAAGNYQFDAVLRRPAGWAVLAKHPSVVWHDKPVPPVWDGGKVGTLLVTPDDGLGDQILLARFLPQLKRRGAQRLVVMAQTPLVRLLSRMPCVDEVWPVEYNIRHEVTVPSPRFRVDARISMNGLPWILGCTIDSIPVPPYLSADPEDIQRFGPRLPQTGLRVGLVWRTSPVAKQPERRSFPLATLAPLWEVPGVSFVCLQKMAGEAEAKSCPLPLTRPEIRDLADLAAVISGLDLLVGPDVCAMNVGGALGKPTWVVTDPTVDFRWLHPWYPTGRVFRQKTDGDWTDPIAEVARELTKFAADIRSSCCQQTYDKGLLL